MICQLTAAGQALLESNTGPVTVTSFQLGSAYGYIPEASDTGIHGTLVYSGVPSAPLAVSANLVVYSSYLDYDLGPFEFGEIGLFVGSTLFALATGSASISKLAPGDTTSGNSIRIDQYVSVVGTNYQMWLNLAESSNAFQMAVITSPDLLPQSSQAVPNAYVISGVVNSQSAFLAYTDKLGLWNFDAYQYGSQVHANVVSSDSQSVTIALDQYVAEMQPQYFGQVILEFTSGALYSVCRYVQTAIISGNFVTLGFDSPIAMQPAVGDSFATFVRTADSEIPQFPPATTSELGGVIVGQYLTVQPNGLLAVSAATLPYPVTSVDGQTGAVVVQAINSNSASGTSLISDSGATTGNIKLKSLVAGSNISIAPDANGNLLISDTYTLPVASLTTLGGVKAPSDGNLTISPTGVIDLGFTPVTSVDGMTGAVVLPLATTSAPGLMQVGTGLSVTNGVVSLSATGLVTSVDGQTGAVVVEAVDNNTGSGTTLITDSGATTGVIKLKRIVAGSGVTFAPDAYGNLQINSAATGVTSVDGQTGAVIVEAVDNSDASGVTLITDSGATTGQIKLKTLVAGTNITLASDTNGNLKINSALTPYTLPVATTTVLGGVKQGSGVSIAGDGTLSVTATSPVTSVSGQTGAVVVQATDNNTATGTSLIANSGATTGNIKLLRLVAGTNISLTTDASSNLVINNSAASAPVTSVSGQTGAVVVQASDNNAATGTSLIANNGATTGNIKLLRLVAGANVTLTTDGSSNLVINSSAAGVTTFNTRSGAVTLSSSDISGASGALLSDVAAAKYYDLQGGAAGAITASQILMQYVSTRTITFAAGLGQAYAATAPTASVTLSIQVGGSQVGTIIFAAGSHTGSFTANTAYSVSPGQVVTVVAPASADATFATVSFTLLGLAT